MYEDPANSPYRPNAGVQHDAPTEMFQANYPTQQAPGTPFSPGQRPTPNVRPEQLINKGKAKTLPPGPWRTKLAYLWRNDPAYRVLFIAIGAVVLCSLIGLALLGTAFSHWANPGNSTSAPNQADTQSNTPTPDAQQTSAANATPTATPTTQPTATPTLAPTPTPVPTQAVPTPTSAINNGPLTAQITGIPGTVNNHTTVNVTVMTKPGATVALAISYTAIPAFQQTTTVVADANGVATIPWSINESSFSKYIRNATANVVAVARDENDQQVNSQPATVHIIMG